MDSYTETLAKARRHLREQNRENMRKSTLTKEQIEHYAKYLMKGDKETSAPSSPKKDE